MILYHGELENVEYCVQLEEGIIGDLISCFGHMQMVRLDCPRLALIYSMIAVLGGKTSGISGLSRSIEFGACSPWDFQWTYFRGWLFIIGFEVNSIPS